MDDDRLLNIEELCGWLKVSRATVYRWRQEGLPALKVSRLRKAAVRFAKSDVEAWLRQRTAEAAGAADDMPKFLQPGDKTSRKGGGQNG